jgi:hypothetical protein
MRKTDLENSSIQTTSKFKESAIRRNPAANSHAMTVPLSKGLPEAPKVSKVPDCRGSHTATAGDWA